MKTEVSKFLNEKIHKCPCNKCENWVTNRDILIQKLESIVETVVEDYWETPIENIDVCLIMDKKENLWRIDLKANNEAIQ